MDWKEYEQEIHHIFLTQYPESNITYDAKRIGIYSKADRQIDILIEDHIAGNRFSIAIDCKHFNKKIDIKGVESFIGMPEDIGAQKGLLISKEGFSEAALNRAHFGPTEVELDILNFKDLHKFQGHGGILYRGENVALVPAPFGWIIDGTRTSNWLAVFYQRGFTLEDAAKRKEFMYVQIWDRKENNENLDDLLKTQEADLRKIDSAATIEYIPTIKRRDERVVLRTAKLRTYPTTEYTGFVEFDDFIFFCVLFSPENRSRQNIRKLENILGMVLAIKVQQAANRSK